MLTFARNQNVQVLTGGVSLQVIESERLNFLGGHDDDEWMGGGEDVAGGRVELRCCLLEF